MEQKAATTKPGAISHADLIDDRSLTTRDDDEFHAVHIVDQLVTICSVATTPSNIALYGSWGSGKTSVSNLLEQRLNKEDDVAFARFNAFKYAEVPLRRHFISQIASSLGIEDPKYGRGLYLETTSADFKLPKGGLKKLFRIILGALSIAIIIAAFVASLVALAEPSAPKDPFWEPFRQPFVEAFRSSITGIFVTATLATAIIGIVYRLMDVTVKRSRPSSDEEFEQIFGELVVDALKSKSAKRLVVFIDELDRCSPHQIAGALETLRTFLEVDKCVFIVAADQHVLEHALTVGARQLTPPDPSNPYYSSGSAYLDKIFNLQMSLPTVPPRRLTSYAVDLARNQGGVWSELDDVGHVVSVLIPTHVSSQRRVKTLLNRFALLYRLACRRDDAGLIGPGTERRAAEIAKLACLEAEFPLFAADLRVDSRIVDVVLEWDKALSDGDPDEVQPPGIPAAFPPELHDRAREYASGDRAPAELLYADLKDPATADEERDDDITVVHAHAKQLVRYLRRTDGVPGPLPDIIHLESSGAPFGLLPEIALALDRFAADGASDDIQDIFADRLNEQERNQALLFLSQLLTESRAVGVEVGNVVDCILAGLVETFDNVDEQVARTIASSVATYGHDHEWPDHALAILWKLALACNGGDHSNRLARLVIGRQELGTDLDLASTVVAGAGALGLTSSLHVGSAMATVLREAHNVEELLSSLDPNAAGTMLAIAGKQLRDDIRQQDVQIANAEKRKEAIAADPNTPTVEDAAQLDKSIESANAQIAVDVAAIVQVVEYGQSSDRADLETLGLRLLLDFDHLQARNRALEHLNGLQTGDELLVAALVRACTFRVYSEWPTWLDAIEPESMSDTDNDRLGKLGAKLYAAVRDDKPDWERSAQSVLRVGAAEGLAKSVKRAFERDTGSSVAIEDIDERARSYECIVELADQGVLVGEEAVAMVLDDIAGQLERDDLDESASQLEQRLIELCTRHIDNAAPTALERVLQARGAWWVSAQGRDRLELALSSRLAAHPDATRPPVASAVSVIRQGDIGAPAVAAWISAASPTAREVLTVLAERTDWHASPVLVEALSQYCATASPAALCGIHEGLAPTYIAGLLPESVLTQCRPGELRPTDAASILEDIAPSTSNYDERQRLLKLWHHFAPSTKSSIERAVDAIYLPLLADGRRGSTQLAIQHFALVKSANGKRTEIAAAMIAATEDDDQLRPRAERILEDAGFAKRTGWLRRKTIIEPPDKADDDKH